jgi:hypothetical protein
LSLHHIVLNTAFGGSIGMVAINKYSNVPLYCQLKNLILDKIEKGEFEADSKIPSEQAFL